MKFISQKLEAWAYRMEKFRNPNFNRFYDRSTRVTDRQTNGRAIAYSALSIYAICCRALKIVQISQRSS